MIFDMGAEAQRLAEESGDWSGIAFGAESVIGEEARP